MHPRQGNNSPCFPAACFFILLQYFPNKFLIELQAAAYLSAASTSSTFVEDSSVKCTLVALALLSAGYLSAQTAPSSTLDFASPVAAGGDASTEVCASTTDAENLCAWDSAKGTHGRKCTLDVEKIERTACKYGEARTSDRPDHKPMCFSIHDAEHIVFTSGRHRRFRVRRFVPITATGANGQACPKDPFGTSFDEHKLNFSNTFDSAAAKAESEGCKYKLEVQFHDLDPHAPLEPHDRKGRHFECRDPHIKVTGTGS